MHRIFDNIEDLIWYDKYRKGDEKTYEETVDRVMNPLRNDFSKQEFKDIGDAIKEKLFLPGGRILSNFGTDAKKTTSVNCYVMPNIEDSLHGENSIMDILSQVMKTLQAGGGVGLCFDYLRPKGAYVAGVDSVSSGPCSYLTLYNSGSSVIRSAGSRRGAMLGAMFWAHPDIFEFISAKENDGSLSAFNLSVKMTSEFFDKVRSNSDIYLYHWVKDKGSDKNTKVDLKLKHYQNPFHHIKQDDISIDEPFRFLWGDRGIYEIKIDTKIKAKQLFDKICEMSYNTGDPGLLFIDKANELNNLREIEEVSTSNPCAEQILPPAGACVLGSLVLSRFLYKDSKHIEFNYDKLVNTVLLAVKFLDGVIDHTRFPLETQREEAQNKRRIGLGITGLADVLIAFDCKYGSPKSLELIQNVFKLIRDTAYTASINMAKEKGCFPLFNKDTYGKNAFVSSLPEVIKDSIKQYGIRNSHLLTCAPVGTGSLLAGNVSSGIEPIFSKEPYTRYIVCDKSYDYVVEYYDGTKFLATKEELSQLNEKDIKSKVKANIKKQKDGVYVHGINISNWVDGFGEYDYEDAHQLSMHDHLNVQKTCQIYVDSSISKTINVPNDCPYESYVGFLKHSDTHGLKGLTIFRDGCKQDSILKKKEEEEKKEEEPKEEKREFKPQSVAQVQSAKRWKFNFPEYKGLIIIGPHTKQPKEVIVVMSKSGQTVHGLCEAVGRLISMSLQWGVPIKEVVKQLIDIQDHVGWFQLARGDQKPIVTRSVPDTIAKILLHEYMDHDKDTKLGGEQCPVCFMDSVHHLQGCETCTACGWSKCG